MYVGSRIQEGRDRLCRLWSLAQYQFLMSHFAIAFTNSTGTVETKQVARNLPWRDSLLASIVQTVARRNC